VSDCEIIWVSVEATRYLGCDNSPLLDNQFRRTLCMDFVSIRQCSVCGCSVRSWMKLQVVRKNERVETECSMLIEPGVIS
jgi:hypothetical protein